ncbi:bile salt sulfotransferase-like [Sapajus apella]|uniref:Sulfotransferase n=1 Tax=Sapajus apella TaxID=9515 RepID=A0A6J3GNJ5_SAPAP|nr:bile salt sulfotransferase-like [Sapajus apella]
MLQDSVQMSECLFFEGLPMPSILTNVETLCFAREEFLVRDDDVIIVSYPRSGTHWIIEILNLIHVNGDPTWIQTVPVFLRSPWIEDAHLQKDLINRNGPRLMVSHLPVQLFPRSYFNCNAKVVYILRNPKDIITSLYHVSRGFVCKKQPENFDEFLNRFIKGDVHYGSWFDHTLGWIKKRDMGSFLLIFYEELQRDPRGSVEKICQFLGKKLKPEEIDLVIRNSSFSAMKENKMSDHFAMDGRMQKVIIAPMLRKGVSGDWKNHFTVAQSEDFDKLFQEKMSRLDPGLFPWF